MDPTNSLVEVNLIAALLCDVSTSYGGVFKQHAYVRTVRKIRSRVSQEGLSFLTKTLPTLGKALDKGLVEGYLERESWRGFKPLNNSELPRFLGEFFQCIFSKDGKILPDPCVESISVIRQICYLFYKYKLPYTELQERNTCEQFEKTEHEVRQSCETLRCCLLDNDVADRYVLRIGLRDYPKDSREADREVVRKARVLLNRVFGSFDPYNIVPGHGPGVVATKQRLGAKFLWSNVCKRITEQYPFDAYFCASMGHVCDSYSGWEARVSDQDLPAQVLLVQKDSRGPRLISCEPVDFQWVQQGLSRAIVHHVERHKLTKFNVFFTDQVPNRIGALYGSESGKYATLDLAEASDRVSLDLVRLLFPEHLYKCLEACRSRSTRLPDGRIIELQKYAPMGSALCFPVMALTIWALLAARSPDADTRESIHVYGDDVIVPTAYAADAIEQLERFGLKVNRRKSCTSGFFRESCGMDAYKGVDVTPVRIRTVWSSAPSPEVYTSWIAYANSFYDKQFYSGYEYIVQCLLKIYKQIPGQQRGLAAPSLREEPANQPRLRARVNRNLQKLQYYVWVTQSPIVRQTIDGWSMLLRYFTEFARPNLSTFESRREKVEASFSIERSHAPAVSQYTARRTSMLVHRWR